MAVFELKCVFFTVLYLFKLLAGNNRSHSCRCILPSHRALRSLISPTENEHSAVSVVMHTTWPLYRLLQYKACSYSNPAPRMKPIKVLFLALALCFFLSPHFSLNLCISKCFHMKDTSGVLRLFVHLVLGVSTI